MKQLFDAGFRTAPVKTWSAQAGEEFLAFFLDHKGRLLSIYLVEKEDVDAYTAGSGPDGI
jgi:hypothetical protein